LSVASRQKTALPIFDFRFPIADHVKRETFHRAACQLPLAKEALIKRSGNTSAAKAAFILPHLRTA
jgi:hypothetical protein